MLVTLRSSLRSGAYILALQLAGTAAFADIDTGLAALDGGDVATAASEFQASFEGGDGNGAFYLGRLFEFGLGTDVDMSRAANLYAAGADKGSILAMNRLGLLYLEGTTLLRDYAEAGRYFCQAAELGDQNGELNCALMLKEGKGMEVDAAKAVSYFEASSAQGNIAAQNLLGQILLAGDGVPADQDKAVALFSQTAEAGNAMGLYELAKHYSAGETPDLVKAYSFANLAAVRQHPEATALRNALEVQMDNSQVTAGQAESKAWTDAQIAKQAALQQEQSK